MVPIKIQTDGQMHAGKASTSKEVVIQTNPGPSTNTRTEVTSWRLFLAHRKGQLLKNVCDRLWFLGSALFPNEFYQCMKFQIDSLSSLEIMGQTQI